MSENVMGENFPSTPVNLEEEYLIHDIQN